MNDEVGYAAGIGASINRGSGSLAALAKGKGKEKDTEDKAKGPKKVKSTRTNTPKVEKKDKNIIDAEIVEPVKVKSERINPPAALTYKPQNLPTSGPGSEFNPNVGRQFKEYKPKSGNEIDEVTGPINPNGNPTGKYVNPTGPIF